MSTKALKIGLVGCGAWGSNILRDLLSLGCQVCVADIKEQARQQALTKGAAEVFAHLDEFPECDGYVVAVPIPDLTPVSLSLLPKHKPIFAEKTLCLTLEDADKLEQAGGSKYIFAMHKWHYHPGIEALRVIAGSGKIGDLKQIVSIRHGWVDDFHGGDVFWTLAVHDLTIIKHILGYIPSEIQFASVIREQKGLAVSLHAVLGEKTLATISVNARHAEKQSGVSLLGTRGSAVLHDAYDDHILVRNETGEEKVEIDTSKFPLYLELAEFTQYLLGGAKPRCDLGHAREVTKVLLALQAKVLK